MRLVIASAVAAVPALLVVLTLSRLAGDGKLASAAQLLVGGTVLVAVYLAAALALRVGEVRELSSMLRARIGR